MHMLMILFAIGAIIFIFKRRKSEDILVNVEPSQDATQLKPELRNELDVVRELLTIRMNRYLEHKYGVNLMSWEWENSDYRMSQSISVIVKLSTGEIRREDYFVRFTLNVFNRSVQTLDGSIRDKEAAKFFNDDWEWDTEHKEKNEGDNQKNVVISKPVTRSKTDSIKQSSIAVQIVDIIKDLDTDSLNVAESEIMLSSHEAIKYIASELDSSESNLLCDAKIIADEMIRLVPYNEKARKLKDYINGYNIIKEELLDKKKALEKGIGGESEILTYLNEYNPGDWNIIPSVILPADSQTMRTFENDIIVVCEFGIYTIEVKNYTAGSMEIKKDGRIVHKDSKGNPIDDKVDVLQQSEMHVSLLTKFLTPYLLEQGIKASNAVHGIITFADSSFEITENELDYPICRKNLLRTMILKNDCILSEEQQEKIVNLIVENKMGERKFPYPDLSRYYLTENNKVVLNKLLQLKI